MATRSFIAKLQEDGTYKGVYCHNDGYPEYIGKELLRYFNNSESIDELMQDGDLSFIDNEVKKTSLMVQLEQEYGYRPNKDNLDDNYYFNPTIFYNFDDLLKYSYYSGCEYLYIFKDNKWFYNKVVSIHTPSNLIDLSEVIDISFIFTKKEVDSLKSPSTYYSYHFSINFKSEIFIEIRSQPLHPKYYPKDHIPYKTEKDAYKGCKEYLQKLTNHLNIIINN